MQVNRTKAIGVLSASVAHEINNPLTYMLPCCDYVAMAVDQLLHGLEQVRDEGARALVPTVRQLAEDIAVLQGGMQRIATIANDLRSFAHTSDERAGAVDTAAVVRAVLQLIGKEAARRVYLSVSLGATMTAFGHPSRLIQVVLNLVANALHATARLPKCAAMIVIRTADDGERVRLEVLDSGHGVPPAQRDRIFEPFVTTKVSGDGSGLGLFVSRNIVEQHGGTLTVHEGELGGALFRVGLARYRSRLEEALVSEQSGIEAVKASVLVVDDEPAVGAVLVRQLEKHRHKAIWLDGVAAAVSQVQLSEFDLVFCDLMMEDVEGKPWYEFLARAWPGVQRRLVVMTGGAFSPLAREFAIRNVDRLVEKPFDIAAEVSRRMLDRRAEIET